MEHIKKFVNRDKDKNNNNKINISNNSKTITKISNKTNKMILMPI